MQQFLALAIASQMFSPGVTPSTTNAQQWAQSPGRDQQTFFETGRPRSQDTLMFRRPPSQVPPVRANARNWQFIVFSQGNVSLWMPPGILTKDEIVIDTEAGPINFQTLGSTDGDYRYIAAYAYGLTPQQLEDPSLLFNALRDQVAPEEMFTLMEERPMQLGEYQGAEFNFASDTQTVIFRTYLVGDQVYVIGVEEPANSNRGNARRAFLNSLQFVQ